MLSYRDIQRTIQQIGIDTQKPVLLHIDNSALADVRGGADTLAGALTGIFSQTLVPTFTNSAMVIPAVGPSDNGMEYGADPEASLDAVPFTPTLPADQELGEFAETFRLLKDAHRSLHPLLSFAGIGLPEALTAQTYRKPLAPISTLLEMDANILMLGASHGQNISIHLGEQLAGRKTFIRWALTPAAIAECPACPGCPDGFDALESELTRIETRTGFGTTHLKAYKLKEFVETVRQLIIREPLALLCSQPACPRCAAVRTDVNGRIA